MSLMYGAQENGGKTYANRSTICHYMESNNEETEARIKEKMFEV